MNILPDINTRADIELLLKEFYTKLLQDESIGYIFTDVAKIDLAHHLPILADFWEQTLFHTDGYRNNTMQVHLDLNEKEKLTEEHFNIWLGHFYNTIDLLFKGVNAEKAKTRALSIATIMKIKLNAF